jgi:DNA polymerase III alpha subunit (gram-positive type)
MESGQFTGTHDRRWRVVNATMSTQPMSKMISKSIRQSTIYIVTDIEADGPEPGIHSMLSFASVAKSLDGKTHKEFQANLKPLKDGFKDAGTMQWWEMHPAAWREATKNQQSPESALMEWVEWIERLPGTPVFAAHPLTFDGEWIDWYLRKFVSRRLFDRPREPGICAGAGIDIPSLVMGKTGLEYSQCNRRQYPAKWLGGNDHNHRALDDARGYAHLLMLMLSGAVNNL